MDERRQPDRHRRPVDRRRVLAALAGVTVGSVAGCSSVTEQEFEAQPVGLPEDGREAVALAESGQDSSTVTREVDAVDGEVTITSHSAAYARGPARGTPSLIEKFLGRVNGTTGAGAATVVTGGDAGLGEVTLDFFEEQPTVSGDAVSLLTPAGARGGETLDPADVLVMVPGSAIPGSRSNPISTWSQFWVSAPQWFPDASWAPSDNHAGVPVSRWFTGSEWSPDPANMQVLALAQEGSFEDTFGVSAEEVGGRPLDEGESVPTENTVVALRGDQWAPSDNHAGARAAFTSGAPAPTGGATYGVGVLSTPAAEVAGKSVNPLADMGFEEMLTSESPLFAFSDLPGALPCSGASTCTWLAGPNPIDHPDVPFHSRGGATILDEETDLKSFQGVLSGDDGPWGVAVHMARVEHDSEGGTDVVVVAGTHHWPVESEEYFDVDRGERFTGILGSVLSEAQTVTGVVGERLDPIDRGWA